MRHNNKGYKLGRTRAHRKATLASLSTALITHKRITTTLTKAKALRQYVEPVINRAKDPSTHSRRQAMRHLRSKEAVKELFDDVATAIGDRPGGYTRIVKLGSRAGDGAEMAVIELVDYNDVQPSGTTGTRRSGRTRRGSGRGRRRSKATTQTAEQTAQKAKAKGVESTAVEEPVDEAQAVPVPERTEPNAEAKAAAEEVAEERAAEQPASDTPKNEGETAEGDEPQEGEEKA